MVALRREDEAPMTIGRSRRVGRPRPPVRLARHGHRAPAARPPRHAARERRIPRHRLRPVRELPPLPARPLSLRRAGRRSPPPRHGIARPEDRAAPPPPQRANQRAAATYGLTRRSIFRILSEQRRVGVEADACRKRDGWRDASFGIEPCRHRSMIGISGDVIQHRSATRRTTPHMPGHGHLPQQPRCT